MVDIVHIVLIAIIFVVHIARVEFVVGSYIAYLFVKHGEKFSFGKPTQLLLFAVVISGYSTSNRTLVAIASGALLLSLLSDNRISTFMSGPSGAWIGKLSFPLYLAHVLVIMTVSSFVFVWTKTQGLDHQAIAFALFVTVLGALALSMPFMALESWWVPFLNRKMSSSKFQLALSRR